jgi:uncharacterized cupin superfamily protein
VGLTHFDEAPTREYALGHLRNRWTLLGEAAGSERIGVRRIQIEPGGWSTPAHEHGVSEEIFYVLNGTGVSWQRGRTAAIGAGDCIVYLARRGEHTVRADEPLDLLTFGTRAFDEALRLPRLGISTLGGRAVESIPGPPDGTPVQFIREAELGPPELPADTDPTHPRPRTIVALDDVEPDVVDRRRVGRARRELGRAAGAQHSSLSWVRVAPGKLAHPEQCHTLEEKLFVVLSGSGALLRTRFAPAPDRSSPSWPTEIAIPETSATSRARARWRCAGWAWWRGWSRSTTGRARTRRPRWQNPRVRTGSRPLSWWPLRGGGHRR